MSIDDINSAICERLAEARNDLKRAQCSSNEESYCQGYVDALEHVLGDLPRYQSCEPSE